MALGIRPPTTLSAKFPATVPSVYVRFYAQAQHIDLGYYGAFHGPEAYLETHRQHLAR